MVEVPVVVALVPVPPEFGAHGLGSGSEFSRPCWTLPAPEKINTSVSPALPLQLILQVFKLTTMWHHGDWWNA